MLEEIFLGLLQGSGASRETGTIYWQELTACYNSSGRYYHNLSHLEHMLVQLQQVKHQIADWDIVLFSLYYHDAVYDIMAKDNEAQSALLVEDRMKAIGMASDLIEKCKQQILATASHQAAADQDTNLFTDADLTILGREWPVYQTYCEHVRQEYAVYPDPVYNPGRKAVLQHFLAMKRIFKTDYFFYRFEKQARQNLQQEYDGL